MVVGSWISVVNFPAQPTMPQYYEGQESTAKSEKNYPRFIIQNNNRPSPILSTYQIFLLVLISECWTNWIWLNLFRIRARLFIITNCFQTDRIIDGVPVPYFFIGDPAYPLESWLLKDYRRQDASVEQQNFNEKLNAARVYVEIAFGRLKSMWRILLKNNINYTYMPKIVGACSILHNLILKEERPFQPSLTDAEYVDAITNFPQPETLMFRENDSLSGSDLRNVLCNYINKL